jgi:hypothetical protein
MRPSQRSICEQQQHTRPNQKAGKPHRKDYIYQRSSPLNLATVSTPSAIVIVPLNNIAPITAMPDQERTDVLRVFLDHLTSNTNHNESQTMDQNILSLVVKFLFGDSREDHHLEERYERRSTHHQGLRRGDFLAAIAFLHARQDPGIVNRQQHDGGGGSMQQLSQAMNKPDRDTEVPGLDIGNYGFELTRRTFWRTKWRSSKSITSQLIGEGEDTTLGAGVEKLSLLVRLVISVLACLRPHGNVSFVLYIVIR